MWRVAAAAAWVLASPASAQTLMPAEAFIDLVLGKTIRFEHFNSGRLVGDEQFISRTQTIWKTPEKGCVFGQLYVDRGRVCFLYENSEDGLPVCWWPYDYNGEIIVRPVGEFTRGMQRIGGVSEAPLTCETLPMS
ncbi:hypothetical protein TRL7639_01458 [Falsiruegeria litorea R37]|uniref:Uncharacterized protein n=1 Tax=Falsiruegeria litorea R37 TaxID=1200284 RepID=A0A1Y5S5I1_9RHOB|nr:hypothetical protein [Falsiruegeria litorea]SLN33001.1 hypothetical protein TRL7639_01458 [Falsiruegeria litorea R37]